jgi:hypothetical protein
MLHFGIIVVHTRRYYFPLTRCAMNIEPTKEHPIPFDLSEEKPKTLSDSISIAANTVDLIEALGGSIDFSEKDEAAARALITGAKKTPTPQHVTNPGVARHAAHILKKYDYQAIEDAQQARSFITNKLIELADCGDLKIEIKALELLGKHSDIGIFTERSEITVHHKSSVDLENSIKERIKRLLNSDITDITPLDDLDAQLGPVTSGTFSEEKDNNDEEEGEASAG